VQVVPGTDGLYLFQSFYEWPPERGPSLTGVVALHGGTARSGRSLAVTMGAPGHPSATDRTLRLHVARLYAELRDAMRRGDWSAFGHALDALGQIVGQRP
jgi:uncharacterized membrane protein (UPF0182 family)